MSGPAVVEVLKGRTMRLNPSPYSVSPMAKFHCFAQVGKGFARVTGSFLWLQHW